MSNFSFLYVDIPLLSISAIKNWCKTNYKEDFWYPDFRWNYFKKIEITLDIHEVTYQSQFLWSKYFFVEFSLTLFFVDIVNKGGKFFWTTCMKVMIKTFGSTKIPNNSNNNNSTDWHIEAGECQSYFYFSYDKIDRNIDDVNA